MKREEIEKAKLSAKKQIENANEYIKTLESMTPDEDKPVVMCWYSIYHNDGILCVDQRLDARTEQEAHELVDKKLCNIQNASPHTYKVMVFEAPIRMEVKQSSYPF